MFVQFSCFLYVIGIGVADAAAAAAAVLAWTTDVSSVPAVFFELMTDESLRITRLEEEDWVGWKEFVLSLNITIIVH